MKSDHTRVIAFCAKMERKLDQHLFRDKEEEEGLSPVQKGVATAAGAAYGGSLLKRGLGPMIADRRSGMRAMIPGFTQRSGLAQTAAATGTVLRDKPLGVIRSIGSTVGRDVTRVAGGVAGAYRDGFAGAGMMAKHAGSSIVSRLKGLAGRIKWRV